MNKILIIISVAIAAITVAACSSDMPDEISTSVETTTDILRVKVEMQRQNYDDDSRMANGAWTEGDEIFLCMRTTSMNVFGKLKYSNSNWQVELDRGSLTQDTEKALLAVYIDGKYTISDKQVEVTPYTAVYCAEGTYSYSEEFKELSIKAKLQPWMGRLRFKGTPGAEIRVDGINRIESCDLRQSSIDAALKISGEQIVTEIGEDGYTDYIYGVQGSKPLISITTSEMNGRRETRRIFTRELSSVDMLSKGVSGYMNIPSAEKKNGWDMEESILIGGHEFVDLGLPSGILWAKYNVGATEQNKFGDGFAWGEIKPKDKYYEDNWIGKGKPKNQLLFEGIIDESLCLTPEHDAATANWGHYWRTPTMENVDELLECCIIVESLRKDSYYAEIYLSKVNNETIEMPARIYYNYDYVYDNVYYWCSNLKEYGYGYWYPVENKSYASSYGYKDTPIRAVSDPE